MSLYGVGICSKGKYTGRDINGKITPEYTLWSNALARCYSVKYQQKNPVFYQECSVCEEWLDFQVFATWANTQLYFNRKGFALDKDLTILGSKLYSPDTCEFIPREVNSLLKMNKWNNEGLPQGVNYAWNSTTKYVSSHKTKPLGKFSTAEEAFEHYKKAKSEEMIKVAHKYKDQITDIIFNNLINYKVVPYPNRELLTPISQQNISHGEIS